MANQRAPDQEFIGIWVSNSLAEKIDSIKDGKTRSQWVREAIADLLIEEGIDVSKYEKNGRDRVRRQRFQLNEKTAGESVAAMATQVAAGNSDYKKKLKGKP
jgi:hypothetical protein